jgi:anti-anti-sigma factor
MHTDTDRAIISVETTPEEIVVHFTDSVAVLDGLGLPGMAELLRFLLVELSQEHLILDFRNVLSISSAGLGALVSLHKQARVAGKRLTIREVARQVYEPFEITKLTKLLDIRRALADAPAPAEC